VTDAFLVTTTAYSGDLQISLLIAVPWSHLTTTAPLFRALEDCSFPTLLKWRGGPLQCELKLCWCKVEAEAEDETRCDICALLQLQSSRTCLRTISSVAR
jgi:hypothetical protein